MQRQLRSVRFWLVSNYRKSFAKLQVGRDGILHKFFSSLSAQLTFKWMSFASFLILAQRNNGNECEQRIIRLCSVGTPFFHDNCCEYAYVKWVNKRPAPTPSQFRFNSFPLPKPVSSRTERNETEAMMFEMKNWKKIRMTSWGGWVDRQIRQTS